MKIKRILAFSLVGVMMLGLVGCGKDKQDEVVIPDSTDTIINGEEWPTDETTSTEPSEEVTEPSVEETPAPEKVEKKAPNAKPVEEKAKAEQKEVKPAAPKTAEKAE